MQSCAPQIPHKARVPSLQFVHKRIFEASAAAHVWSERIEGVTRQHQRLLISACFDNGSFRLKVISICFAMM